MIMLQILENFRNIYLDLTFLFYLRLILECKQLFYDTYDV